MAYLRVVEPVLTPYAGEAVVFRVPGVAFGDGPDDTVAPTEAVNDTGGGGQFFGVIVLKRALAPSFAVISREVDTLLGASVEAFAVAGYLVGIVYYEFPIGVDVYRNEGK